MRFFKEIKKLIKSAKITNFPIGLTEIKQIVQQSGWEIYSYKEAVEIIDSYKLQEMVEKNDSFASNIGNRIVIFYNSEISQLDLPYVLAHKIGHIVLGHLGDVGDIYSKERDCGCFANELLEYTPNRKAGIFCGIGAVVAVLVSGIILFNQNYSITQNTSQDTGVNITISIDENVLSEHILTETTPVYITQYGEKFHLEGCRYIKTRIILLRFRLLKLLRLGMNIVRFVLMSTMIILNRQKKHPRITPRVF